MNALPQAKIKTNLSISITFFLGATFGCATHPPARIENGLYINPKYAFSIRVPEGWQQTEKTPPWMNKGMPPDKRAKIRIMFFNKGTNGIIFVASKKTFVSFDSVSRHGDRVYEDMKSKFQKEKERQEKLPYVKYYSYEFSYIREWSEEVLLETEMFVMKGKARGFLYGCHQDDSCIVSVNLVSEVKTFDQNYEVFEKVVKSLRTGFPH